MIDRFFSFDLRCRFSVEFYLARRHGAGRKKKIAAECWVVPIWKLTCSISKPRRSHSTGRTGASSVKLTDDPEPEASIAVALPHRLPRQRRRSRVRRACVEVSRARPGAGDDGVAARPARGDKRGVGRHGTRGSGVGGDGDRASRAPPSSRQRIILLGPTARSLGLGHPALTPHPLANARRSSATRSRNPCRRAMSCRTGACARFCPSSWRRRRRRCVPARSFDALRERHGAVVRDIHDPSARAIELGSVPRRATRRRERHLSRNTLPRSR